jgi:hypothetical protein
MLSFEIFTAVKVCILSFWVVTPYILEIVTNVSEELATSFLRVKDGYRMVLEIVTNAIQRQNSEIHDLNILLYRIYI